MFSSWAYILIGNNNTGKTSFQRNVVAELCNEHYTRLPRNVLKTISHPRAPRKLATIFTCNRSYQEKLDEYKSVKNYFNRFFKDADICFLSSHTHGDSCTHVEEMIHQLKLRCYNVAGIFWSNGFDTDAEAISALPWQERLWVDNPLLKDPSKVSMQLVRVAHEFTELLLERSRAQ
jgi:hypothetical protein